MTLIKMSLFKVSLSKMSPIMNNEYYSVSVFKKENIYFDIFKERWRTNDGQVMDKWEMIFFLQNIKWQTSSDKY